MQEVGSRWVQTLCRRETIALSTLSLVEFASLTTRRRHEGTLNQVQFRRITRRFTSHEQQYFVIDASRDVVRDAATIVRRMPPSIPLRSLDAIQIACATAAFRRARQEGFQIGGLISADRHLLAAAQHLGLPVDNPENHP